MCLVCYATTPTVAAVKCNARTTPAIVRSVSETKKNLSDFGRSTVAVDLPSLRPSVQPSTSLSLSLSDLPNASRQKRSPRARRGGEWESSRPPLLSPPCRAPFFVSTIHPHWCRGCIRNSTTVSSSSSSSFSSPLDGRGRGNALVYLQKIGNIGMCHLASNKQRMKHFRPPSNGHLSQGTITKMWN